MSGVDVHSWFQQAFALNFDSQPCQAGDLPNVAAIRGSSFLRYS